MSRSKLAKGGFFVKNVCEKCGTEIMVWTKPHSHRRLTAPLHSRRKPPQT